MSEFSRILVIDDDESFRKIVEYNLRQAGYEVVCAQTGSEGLAWVEKESFGVVITDIKMPGPEPSRPAHDAREGFAVSNLEGGESPAQAGVGREVSRGTHRWDLRGREGSRGQGQTPGRSRCHRADHRRQNAG